MDDDQKDQTASGTAHAGSSPAGGAQPDKPPPKPASGDVPGDGINNPVPDQIAGDTAHIGDRKP